MRSRLCIVYICLFIALLFSSCETGINLSAHVYFYPRDLNFGSVNVGSEKELTLEISNPGSRDLSIYKMRLITDSDTTDQEMFISEAYNFNGSSISTTLTNIKVKKNEYMLVKFMFRPTDSSPKSAILSLTHNASNHETPYETTITGNSSTLTVTPKLLDFGKVNYSKKIEKDIVIQNTSSSSISIYSLNLSGSTDYKIESDTGFSVLTPSQKRFVTISFLPTKTGLITSILNINHNSSGSPSMIDITGIGVPDENRPPNVRQATVNPDIVKADGTELVLFSADISDDNGYADIKSVTINLEKITGSTNQEMFDDGTNGDLIANDHIYSFEYVIPSGLSPKGYEITITAYDFSDTSGTGVCYIRVYSGNKIYVSDSLGNDSIGYGTENSPYKTIQKGIDESETGDWVIVKDGTYDGVGNVDLNFANNLPLYKTREIILQSENGPDKTIIDCTGSNTSRHRGFRFTTLETASSVVDGFSIINGYVLSTGGGIMCSGSSPTIQNCKITNCYSGDKGGAIYCESNSQSTIINNYINNNKAQNGGGISAVGTQISILDNTIINNESTLTGAGISIAGGTVIITGNIIKNNSLVSSVDDVKGAGIFIKGNAASPIISGNNVIDNYLRSSSGMCLGSGIYSEITNASYSIDNNNIESNIIHNNSKFAHGGGVYISGSKNSAKLFNNNIILNEAYSSDGVAAGGGLFIATQSSPIIKFNTISENICKSQTSYVYGGGVYIDEHTTSEFSENKVNMNNIVSVSNNCYGGGIYISTTPSQIEITNCEINSNFGTTPPGYRVYGAGMFVDDETVLIIDNCDISENSSHMASYGYGIGLFINEKTTAIIMNTTINSNKLESSYYCYGIGAFCYTDTAVTFKNCEISNNESLSRYDGYGGAIYLRQGSYTIENCKIDNNALNSTRNAYGGGIYCYNYVTVTITNCSITNNTCTGSVCRGGGIYTYYNHVTMQVVNCLIADNILDSTDAAYGAALYAYYSVFNLQNCTLTSNEAISDTGDARGGAIYIYYTYITTSINNSIIWGNQVISRFSTGSPNGHAFYIEIDRTYIVMINNCLYPKKPKNGVESIYDPYSLLSPNLACVFDSDPFFVDVINKDYRLQHTNIGYNHDSPAIDRGNKSLIPSYVTTDLDGNPRFVDGLKNGGVEIDMGCYEKQN